MIERQPHNATLFGDGLQNTLSNPPHGVGNKLETAGLIKFLGSFYQSNVAFIDEVGEREALMLILLARVVCENWSIISFPQMRSLSL